MFEGPTQDFAIDCRLDQGITARPLLCEQSTWFIPTLLDCTRFLDDMGYRLGDLMMITFR
jgi:hypothetical protein